MRAAGGTAEEPHEEPYGLVSGCADDQDMQFALYALDPVGWPRPAANGAVQGDLSYVTVETVDAARFRRFFGAVAGWRFSPGRAEDGWGVDGIVPMTGIHGGHPRTTVVPMYRVDDITAAVGGCAPRAEPRPTPNPSRTG